MWDSAVRNIGARLARYLEKPLRRYEPFSVHDVSTLRRHLRPGDVLLVEGNARISSAIKYLTQSTWSHLAFYTGPLAGHAAADGEPCALVEAELSQGVVASPVSKYEKFNTRICRAVGLTDGDRERVVRYMIDSIGKSYDLKNLFDLMRYLLPTPPVPVRLRRRMIALGSGDPSRAICSTLIAQAFQSIRYPILPFVEKRPPSQRFLLHEKEIYHIRHHSLYAPRDFDLSPYFAVVKPTVASHFDYKKIQWNELSED
ncbi:MAG: lipo-like protein [Gammaproteobacteria bacterium]|nr:lipo-like protein [Gammaproteobacteria bacterium]MDD9800051.1 lipo-like protein [Gammaproteobacteria bacterium]MDD9851622.1 lipo-like protein [Gammaproteobacteria bacterium]MDD9870463.1 lipo-like protein [Gammaproteobacteria bacterium]